MVVQVRRTERSLELDLTGEWRALQFAQIDAALAAIDLAGTRRLVISTEQLAALDLSGAWRLREFLKRARDAGAEVTFRSAPPDQLRLIDEALQAAGAPAGASGQGPGEPAIRPLTFIGRESVLFGQDLFMGFAFLGRVSVTAARALTSLKRLRPISVARHVYDTGITAMPIVALIAFLISVIIAYMSAQQLRNFGAEIFVVDLVTIGVLRELGVLLTAIIVAGRSGSAFAAEIGSMKLNEEVDALYATGVDPFEVLVLPRVLGLVIALPLLAIVADLIGLTGGALLCRYLLDMPLSQYVNRANEAIAPTTFWVGIIKAPVFAALIALAGCYRGMQVRGSSRELGRLTTQAVVQAIFLVILADALFAVLFMEMNI
ncbi:MAG: ABC transporter permease [Gammaproteobacteria bacterium]|nr:MAG: ABC transporter permease [Gammaproteobacteria bacterium]